jgi:hypothetical protein
MVNKAGLIIAGYPENMIEFFRLENIKRWVCKSKLKGRVLKAIIYLGMDSGFSASEDSDQVIDYSAFLRVILNSFQHLLSPSLLMIPK